MENLIINTNPDQIYIPSVYFEANTGNCEIAGESYMEETYKFYHPLIQWLKCYIENNLPITFNFKLTYFNTSSSRFIIEILELLKKHEQNNGKVEVNWFYKKNDPDILIEIEDFTSETGMEINTIEF